MRNKSRRWLFFWILTLSHLHGILCKETDISITNGSNTVNDKGNAKNLRNIFSPRMDYDQWKPLGRGDPLKNDPTFDYVPPVLDRVHYWVDPSSRKPDPSSLNDSHKTEILLLGVSSKKPSTGISLADSRKDDYDPFLKFVEGPKFNPHQRISRPHYSSTSTGYYPTSNFYGNRNKLSERNSFTKANEQRVPYTMLVPPPLLIKKLNTVAPTTTVHKSVTPQQSTINTKPTYTTLPTSSDVTWNSPNPSASTVTVQAADLVYQSSSLSSDKDWFIQPTTSLTNIRTSTPPSFTTSPPKIHQLPFNEDIVFQRHLQPPESYIQIDFSPTNFNLTNKPLITAGSDYSVNFVTPPSYSQNSVSEIMHKGQVADDNIDISNAYVKIGKTEVQMHSADIIPSSPVFHKESQIPNLLAYPNVNDFVGVNDLPMIPMTGHSLLNMQTMQPPPSTQGPVFTKAVSDTITILDHPTEILEATDTKSNYIITSSFTPTTFETTSMMTTTTEVPTTTSTTLTTNPLLKHYKQPMEPMRGPLYLIIQGHSKVKTYGPSKQIHGIAIQDTNEITDGKEDDKYSVRHLHTYMGMPENQPYREGRSGNLQTLKHVVQSGLGAINFLDIDRHDANVGDRELHSGAIESKQTLSDSDDKTVTRTESGNIQKQGIALKPHLMKSSASNRRNDEVQETELQFGYEVVSGKDVTSEKYHKGIVEEARKLKDFDNLDVSH